MNGTPYIWSKKRKKKPEKIIVPAEQKTFTVLTVSKRTGWEQRAIQQIEKQTIKPAFWYVVTEEQPLVSYDVHERFVVNYLQSPPKIRLSNLNRSLNYGLRQITNDYVIFYQDFIDLPLDCFEKLLTLADSKTFVTTATINDDGTMDSRYWGEERPEGRPCKPYEWEANVAIAPMNIIRRLGGFEEELDNGWAWDNVHLAQRAAMLGCRFLIDETNKPQLLYHEKETGMPINDIRCANDIAKIRAKKKPLRLKYLD